MSISPLDHNQMSISPLDHNQMSISPLDHNQTSISPLDLYVSSDDSDHMGTYFSAEDIARNPMSIS
jgi:hypothetical protein